MTDLVNPTFATGTLEGWTLRDEFVGISAGVASVSSERPYVGTYSGKWLGTHPSENHSQAPSIVFLNDARGAVATGQSVTARAIIAQNDTNVSANWGRVRLYWFDSTGGVIDFNEGNMIAGNYSNYSQSTVTATAPAGAAFAALGVWVRANSSGGMLIGSVSWNHVDNRSAVLTSPTNGGTYTENSPVPFRIVLSGSGSLAPTSVHYWVRNTVTSVETEVAVSSTSPFNVNVSTLDPGTYEAWAVAEYPADSITTALVDFTVGAIILPTREYKASNSYTYMVMEGIQGLGSQVPSTALVTGVEITVAYDMEAISRALDLGISDPTQATADVIFDITQAGTMEAIMLEKDGESYTQIGANMTSTVDLIRSDFNVEETGVSQGKKWTLFTMDDPATVSLGGDALLFGGTTMAITDFLNKAIGLRFYPVFTTKPEYADSGDGAFRMQVNSVKVSVYFDAGSVEYYFASPDKTQVIKGTLVSANILEGRLQTGDAAGVLQLMPTLEVVDGTQTWIGSDWTIHSVYPPTDANQIGLVDEVEDGSAVGMRYNGLPTQRQVRDNRSRYKFITENFYGDPNLNSMYGVHGLPRAFAYNNEYFYKIYTQADPDKDSPRSLANHHTHLALGFHGGRVDISVVGEPYNFDGVLGASSWAFGDKVVGLLPLSGTILGVFGSKSIQGISGTTVDNFATQVISPNIGAIEYTIADMGFPIYANAYGVYTLDQTQKYGDYLGEPMSRDISPWIRPRLLRKKTSNKEVECAFPVRSKNQYRLCFADGYIMTMTLNGAQTPTFAPQKYFYTTTDAALVTNIYEQNALVPAAVSSELDDAGEERIHIAPYMND